MHSLSLLPKLTYILKINSDCLVENGNFFLIRRADASVDEVYNENLGYVKAEAFISHNNRPLNELPGLSMNLKCKHCKENSTDYKTNEEGSAPWDGKTIVENKDIGKFCIPTGVHTNVFLPLNKLHRFNYFSLHPKQGDSYKRLEKLGFKDLSDITIDDVVHVKVKGGLTVEVIHKPTLLNYWHFELECKILNKEIKRNHNASEKATLKLFLDQYISAIADIYNIGHNELDPINCYIA